MQSVVLYRQRFLYKYHKVPVESAQWPALALLLCGLISFVLFFSDNEGPKHLEPKKAVGLLEL